MEKETKQKIIAAVAVVILAAALAAFIGGCAGGQKAATQTTAALPPVAYCPSPSSDRVYELHAVGRLSEPIKAKVTDLNGVVSKQRIPAGAWISVERDL